MIAYDHAARSNQEGYILVVEALLRYVNERGDDPSLQYNATESLLTLFSDNKVRVIIWEEWGSNESLLRFLTFRSLKPTGNGRFYLGYFHNLQLETLDLRACKTLIISNKIRLPMLRTVYVRPNQFDLKQLRAAIHANEPFEIIEE